MIIFRLDILGHQAGSHSLILRKIDPATCMVGPSLPMIPPPRAMIRLEMIFTTTIVRFSSLLTLSLYLGVASSMAAITWGIPLPLAKGAHWRTTHQAVRKHSGVTIKSIQK